MAKKNLTELENQLSLALECAALCNMQSSWASWGDPSPFQKIVNTLLVACGRKRTPRPTKRVLDGAKSAPKNRSISGKRSTASRRK